ncbi:MAG: glucose-1-phosphate adenylyltransferase [Planctomycetota bacterium]|jgi:glucose-1-phosphate adenylyltransferase
MDISDAVAMVMAGGRGERLGPLTVHRAKPAVPFGGIYRLIDFTLSNCINSGLRRVFVLTQYRSVSLTTHLRDAWSFLPAHLHEFILPLSPHQWTRDTWYLGTADAIYQNLRYLAEENPALVFVLAGDHIYKMDYRRMVEFHLEKDADVTVGAVAVPLDEGGSYGVIEVDDTGRIVGFAEKPRRPRPMPDAPNLCYASMGIYLFHRKVLEEALHADAVDPESQHDFGKNVIPGLARDARAFAFGFRDAKTGKGRFWRDVGTIDAYHDTSLDLVSVSPRFNLYSRKWPILSVHHQMPPPKFVFAQEGEKGRRGVALDSLVSPGCIVSGGRVHRSVLSPGVRVNSFARVERSVLMDGVEIGRHAVVRNAIVDKEVFIPESVRIGIDPEKDRERFYVSPKGVVVLSKRSRVDVGEDPSTSVKGGGGAP